ncbi:hypothetical protein DFH09DRAFT_1454489 [Mycena vulgaris]|nr:hypothetical protein DFH09DRAFT_1454489 [Mycena vulgaris]
MTEINGRDIPLRNLYLNGEKAALAIAVYLTHPVCKLESLYIASNPIGDAGALSMAEALKSNKHLRRLGMSSTGLTSKCLSALCASLSTFTSIRFSVTTRALFNNLGGLVEVKAGVVDSKIWGFHAFWTLGPEEAPSFPVVPRFRGQRQRL